MVRLHASTAGDVGSIPGRRTKIPHGTWCGKKKIFFEGGEAPRRVLYDENVKKHMPHPLPRLSQTHSLLSSSWSSSLYQPSVCLFSSHYRELLLFLYAFSDSSNTHPCLPDIAVALGNPDRHRATSPAPLLGLCHLLQHPTAHIYFIFCSVIHLLFIQ